MKDQERTPLRVVLRNFLNHIENLESQSCAENSYDAEFQDLKLFSETVKSLKEYSCLEGEKEVNRKKNRYKDILPFDLSRVVLNEYAGIPGSDYINANFIKGASGSPAYIASQGPLPSTVNDFWRMVVQCEVQVIVMACNEEEAGKAKCEKYWVDEGEEKQFGMISVKLLKSSTVCSDFSVRTMRLKYNNSQSAIEERTVCQLHYVAWPDHGVPTVVQPLLDMVRLVRDTQASETLPVLVHCSAGCGRTGTICAIDYVWGLLRTGKLTQNFSLLALIREMRKQRIAMVQTKEQYVLVHQAVRELFKEQLCMIDSHPYENVDPNGLLIINDAEEHVYDSIESLSKDASDEKQDYNKKEKDVPPPLPKKKLQATFPSKKEKDVENLSAQQRAILRMPKVPQQLQTPEKKATPSRVTKPIPSKGILRVPQLETMKSQVLGTVKRSKSLKVVKDERQKLMVCTELSGELKRRGSLESNLEETLTFPDSDIYLKPNSVMNSVKKYEDINSDLRKPLVRSYTTLDMRTKVNADQQLKERPPMPAKVRLSRSNTQVDFSKVANGKSYFPNHWSPDTSEKALNALIDKPIKSFRKENGRTADPILYGMKMAQIPSQDMIDLRKVKPRKMSPYQTVLNKEMEKMNKSGPSHLPSPSQYSRTQNYPMYGQSRLHRVPQAPPKDLESAPLDLESHKKPLCCDLNGSTPGNNFNEPLYLMTPQRNSGNPFSPRTPRMHMPDGHLNKNLPPAKQNLHQRFVESNGEMRYSAKPYIKDTPHETPKMRHNFPYMATPLTKKIEMENIYGRCVNPNKHFTYGPVVKRPMHKMEESLSRATGKQLLHEGHYVESPHKGNLSKPDHLNHRLSAEIKPSYEVLPSSSKQWHGNDTRLGDESDYIYASKPVKTHMIPGGSQNSGKNEDPSKIQGGNNYFQSAPGVDIDQVAASIPQKESGKSNFMKAALEAFSLRSSKQPSKKEEASAKGSSKQEVYSKGKKKQQQYL